MKDLHNHLLYGIDDGSKSIEESIIVLKGMEKEGVTDIVLTPHYIIGTKYNCNNEKKKELLKTLTEHTTINLYLGNEIFLDNGISEYILNGEIMPINNSRYILVEFPLNRNLEYGIEMCDNLIKKGYTPIIAHPERYHYFDIKDLEYLVNSGCLLQGNITSLIDKYGKEARLNLELFIKKHMIHFLGTDTHSKCPNLSLCYEKLRGLTDDYMYHDLLENNFDKVVNNEKVNKYEIVKLKGFFNKERIK